MKKKIVLANGFKCTIDNNVLDDMRLMDLIASLDDNPLNYTKLCVKLLGEDVKEKLYKHIETKDGRVPIETLDKCIEEMMAQLGNDEDIKK